ncbi:MAG: DUF4382 domain-containing protein, partial [Planctomycetes bacterium]|nr:DUF4382 domain-containing protein [Planctomycetota bacterium]
MIRTVLLAACAVALVAFGGGGGSAGTTAAGSVALLLRDGAADYEHVWVTLHEVELRSAESGQRVLLFSSPSGLTVDILDLDDQDFILDVIDDVPAGSYDRVEIEVSSVSTEGGPCDGLDIVVPSGRLVLKPSTPFTVRADEMVTLRLDIDASKSIHLHPAGSSGQCLFRPVIFVEAFSGVPEDRCQRHLEGVVASVSSDPPGFWLTTDSGSLEVRLDPETTVFDAEGLPTSDAFVAIGLTLTVSGRLEASGRFEADVVVHGSTLSVDGRIEALLASGFSM